MVHNSPSLDTILQQARGPFKRLLVGDRMEKTQRTGSSRSGDEPAPGLASSSLCDVQALQKCLRQNNGDRKKCEVEVLAFEQGCAALASGVAQVNRVGGDGRKCGTH